MSCVSNLTIWLSYFENRVNNLDFPKPPGRIDTKHFRCNAILLECVQSLPSHWFSWRYNKMLTFVEVKFPALRHCFQSHFRNFNFGVHEDQILGMSKCSSFQRPPLCCKKTFWQYRISHKFGWRSVCKVKYNMVKWD